jgi:nicotinamidase/pyrazinamidase
LPALTFEPSVSLALANAVNARRLGFAAMIIEPGCRAINIVGSPDAAWAGMAAAGVQRVDDLC